MTIAARPRPPPPTAIGPPPTPRRSWTCDGSSLAPGRNLIGASYLQVANRKRGHRRCEHQRQEHCRPDEQRRARTMGAAEGAELEHDLREAGRVDRQPVQRVLVKSVERQYPPRDPRDVLELLRVDRVPDL